MFVTSKFSKSYLYLILHILFILVFVALKGGDMILVKELDNLKSQVSRDVCKGVGGNIEIHIKSKFSKTYNQTSLQPQSIHVKVPQ